VDATPVFETKPLITIIQHLTGDAPREPAVARQINPQESMLDMEEARGQERAFEIATHSDLRAVEWTA
jgi:hypothetical protein